MAIPIDSISTAGLTPVTSAGAQPAPEQAPAQPPTSASTPAAVQAPQSQTPSTAQVSEQELGKAVEAINRRLQVNGQSLKFSIDRDTDQVVVRVIDTATNEVIRQIPPPVAIAISESVSKFQGLFDQKV